jgi:hypothetical protein
MRQVRRHIRAKPHPGGSRPRSRGRRGCARTARTRPGCSRGTPCPRCDERQGAGPSLAPEAASTRYGWVGWRPRAPYPIGDNAAPRVRSGPSSCGTLSPNSPRPPSQDFGGSTDDCAGGLVVLGGSGRGRHCEREAKRGHPWPRERRQRGGKRRPACAPPGRCFAQAQRGTARRVRTISSATVAVCLRSRTQRRHDARPVASRTRPSVPRCLRRYRCSARPARDTHELGDMDRHHMDRLTDPEPVQHFTSAGVSTRRDPAVVNHVVAHPVDVRKVRPRPTRRRSPG